MKKFILTLLAIVISVNLFAQSTWVQKNNFSFGARASMITFNVQGNGYCALGTDGTNSYNDVWEYNAASDSWSQKASFTGVSRVGAVSCECNNLAYVGLGNSGATYFTDWYEYNATTNNWVQKSSFMGGGRSQAVSFSINNKGYVCTGVDLNYNLQNDLWQFDAVADTWYSKAAIPVVAGGLRFAASFSIGTNGYVVSGYDGTNRLSTVWEYNSTNDTWVAKANAPFIGRSSSFGLSTSSYGFIMGGGATGTPNYSLSDFWKYNPVNDSWIKLDSLPAANSRVEHRGFVLGSDIYVLGGVRISTPSNVYLNDVWKYSTTTGMNNMDEEKNTIQIYKTSNLLYAQSNDRNEKTINIYNTAGQKILSTIFFEKISIPVDALTKGVYIVSVQNSSILKSIKIVIE